MVYDSYEFGKYLMQLRRRDNIPMSVICDGICNVSTMSRIENGEKDVSKIVQDRLLGRLGVAPENFENMIFSDEYERWELRQNIISLIQREEMDEAEQLLEQLERSGRLFERSKSSEDSDAILELQFYLSMKAQISCYRHEDEKKLRKLYEDALRQTVTGLEAKQGYRDFFANKRLSVEEINLLIEYGRYMPEARGITFMRCIVEYIENLSLRKLAMAKVYPKAVYYLYLLEERKGISNEKKTRKLLQLVTDAIEYLRDSLRLFYLCELLDIKMQIIKKLEGTNTDRWDLMTESLENDSLIDESYMKNYGNTMEYSPEAQYIWCRHIRAVLHDIYERCMIREDTFEYGYIYVDVEVYCIEDVIRIRRNMLNMSMAKLSEKICSERTISRIEKKAVKPQRAIVHRLFERLGLSGEFSRTEIISSDIEAQELFLKLKNHLNCGECEKVDELIDIIKNKISMDIPQNKQVIMRLDACNKRIQRKLDDALYIQNIKDALECTLPYDIAVSEGEKYLSNEEMSCMNNILVSKSENCVEVNQCFEALLRINNEREKNINNYLSMYEFTMQVIASYMGDCGKYDESDEKEFTILYSMLINRRINITAMILYCMLWNDQQRKKKKTAMHRGIAGITEYKRCIILTTFKRNVGRYNFFCNHLANEEKQDN